MITLTGKKISEGIAIGKISFYKRDTKEIRRIYVKDVEKEVMRFQKARMRAIQDLKDLYDSATQEVGEANATIFEMQQMILEDQDFISQVTAIIVEQKLNAEYALKNVAENYITYAIKNDKSYVQGHEADVKDVVTRVLRILSRAWKDRMLMDEPFSSLDEQTRRHLDGEIRDIWAKKKRTVIFITHNIDEAIQIGTRIVMLASDAGGIVGEWKPDEHKDHVALKKEIFDSLQTCKCLGRPNVVEWS